MALDLITDQLSEIFDEYSRDMKRKVNNSVDKVGKESVQQLKNTSPKRPGHGEYARSWEIKRERGRNGINDFTIHNKEHYRLTHLLEKGHVIVNAKGTYGRTSPIPHIKPVEDYFNTEVIEEIKRELEQ